MKQILLTRLVDNSKETLSSISVHSQELKLRIFSALELSWKENESNNSCIPADIYKCKVRYSDKYGRHIQILNVPHRDYILIHWGNFNKDTRGCILIGDKFVDIDGDKQLDITASKISFKQFMNRFEDDDEIEILITESIINK